MSQPRKKKAALVAELAALQRRMGELERQLAPPAIPGEAPFRTQEPPQPSATAHLPPAENPRVLGFPLKLNYDPRFCIWDRNHCMEAGNATFLEWFGKKAEEFQGAHAREILGNEAYEVLRPRMEAALAGEEQVFRLEIDYTIKGRRVIQGHYVPRVGADREITGVFAAIIDVTDRLRAEEALLRSERRFRDYAEVSSDWFWELDAGLHFNWVSQRQEEISGVPAEDLVGKICGDIIFPQDTPAGAVDGLQLLRERKPFHYFAYWRPDAGREGRYVVINGVPVFTDEGTFLGYRGTATDLTDRKRAEDALVERERFLRLLTDSVPVLISYVDADLRYGFANSTHARWMGREQGSYLGMRMDEINSKAGFAAIAPRVARALAGEEVKTEDEVVFPDGGTRIVQNFFIPLKDQHQRVVGVISMADDITQQRRAEEARRESEKRFETTVNASPMSIFLKDAQGRFIMVNAAFEKLNGVSAEKAIGKTSQEIFPKEIADRFAAHDREVLASGENRFIETQLPMRGGVVRTVIWTKFPLLADDGTPNAVGTISTDVTELRKVEQQLREAQKMEAVGQLAGGVAHDFNNALQVIINSAYFIRNNPDKKETVTDFADMIVKSGERAAELTQRLLAFGRRNVIQPKPLDLNELVKNLLKMVERIIGEHIALNFSPGMDLQLVEADGGTLEQVIINLCVNARDAMPGGGKIVLETRQVGLDSEFCEKNGLKAAGDYACLSVRDNGVGMGPEVREHLFEPFFTTKQVGEGSGLGLAMAYGIVRQHEGCIELSSEPGAGTTFRLYLPLSKGKEQLVEVAPELPVAAGKEKILVAEDEESVRNLLARLLESVGYQVAMASDGPEALKVFDQEWPDIDLVILDMIMPGMGGREVFQNIRDRGAEVPVVFSTGYTPEGADLDFIRENHLWLVQKPFSPTVLFTAVRDALDHLPAAKRPKEKAAAAPSPPPK